MLGLQPPEWCLNGTLDRGLDTRHRGVGEEADRRGIRQHASAYVRIRQHTSELSVRGLDTQHTGVGEKADTNRRGKIPTSPFIRFQTSRFTVGVQRLSVG